MTQRLTISVDAMGGDDAPEMVALCEELDMAGINRGPLAMGLLTDKYSAKTALGGDDVRGENSPDWMKYFKDGKPNPEWFEKVAAVREIITSEGRSLAQGALAWLWGCSEVTLPIPGFRTVQQVEENAKAMKFGALKQDQIKEINAILER